MTMYIYKKMDIYKLCRLCMCVDGTKHRLFYNSDGHAGQLSSKLKKCIPLQFKVDDPLPKGICDNCMDKIEQFHDFIDQCVKTESVLKSYCPSVGVSDQSTYNGSTVITSIRNGIECIECNYTVPENLNEYDPTDSSNSKNDASENVQTNNSVPNIPNPNQVDNNKINMNSRPYVTPAAVGPEIFHTSRSDIQDLNMKNLSVVNNPSDINNPFTLNGTFISCTLCRKVLKSKHEIMMHHKNCEVIKRYKKSLYNARQRVARKNMPPKFLCNICEKKFKSEKAFVKHLNRHKRDRPHRCNICPKSYVRKHHLVKHALSHKSQGMYRCDVCNKHFNCEDSLLKHKIVHRVTEPFVCQICGISFISQHQYYIHKYIAQGKDGHSSRCRIKLESLL